MSAKTRLSPTWICDICGKRRPDELISVLTRDISEVFNLPIGSAKENIKFCKDDTFCREGSKDKTFFKAVRESYAAARTS